MAPNEMALYPNWLILYVLRIIIPMLILVIVALRILIKSGRDIQREFDIDLTSLMMAELSRKREENNLLF